MRRTLAFVGVTAILLAGLTACRSKQKSDNLPPANELLKAAAAQMATVTAAHFAISSEGNTSVVPLRRADARLTKDGNAQGTLQVEQAGTLVQFTFVIVGQTLYLKGATGGYQPLPLSWAASIYDPTAILDPQRGAAKVLETAHDGKTEVEEKVGAAAAYRVAATFDKQYLAKLIPGAGDNVKGQVWIGTDSKLPLKARFTINGEPGSAPAIITATFTEYNNPVTISAP